MNLLSLGTDLFGFTLRYQNPLAAAGSMAKYNGSISQVDWSSKTLPSALRRYSYSYDGVDRLLGAFYSKPGSTNLATQAYDEQLTYDLNGNIKTLTRYGGLDSSPAQKIDQLTYSYSGNALTKVLDQSGNTQGYPLGGALIPYDANGNMKSHLDKGLSLIDYNHLNLPSKIIHGANTATYSYLADGTKLKKTYGAKTTEYYGALQYEGPEGTPVLQFAGTTEGYFDFVKNAYIYNYLDHLGNLRLSYRKNSAGALEILEETNYYPFGLKHEGYNGGSTATQSYKYKFGGKELQESGMYGFGARMYMPDIGRWGVVDPLGEKYLPFSGYNYVLNNPVSNIDPDGMQVETDYKLLKNGEVKRANPLDGSEKNTHDTLYATDNRGNVDKSNGVTVNKKNASDGSVISGLSQGGNPLATDMLGKSTIPYFSEGFTKNIDDAFNVYNFLDNNTESGIEFSLGNYNINGQDNFQIATMHNINRSNIRSNRFSNDSLIWSVHNHDGEVGLNYKVVGNQWEKDKTTMNSIFKNNHAKGLGYPRFFTVNDNNRMIEITRLGTNTNKTTSFNVQFLKSLKRVYGK